MSILASELKNSIDFLNLIFDNIPTAIMVVDKDARIHSFNNSLTKIFQKENEKLINQLCGNGIGCAFEVDSNLDCGCTMYCDECVLRKGIISAVKERKETNNQLLKINFYINNNSINKYLRFSIKPISLEKDDFAVIFFDDVTDFYELAEKRNELLGIAAHDIRNPLSIIKIYIDYIKSHSVTKNDKISDAFMIIDESINQMIQLLNDILSYASFEKSEIKLQYMKYDYISFIKSIINLQQMIASEKNIKLTFESQLNFIELYFDSNKMTQVINNLISNAIKYSFENSTVLIKVSKIKSDKTDIEYIKTEIIDNGPGIELEEQEKLFKPFSRTNVRPTKNESSTGLGLAIAKQIILAHHGEIGVISFPSKGSNFWFTLPLKNE
ncbi:MAG TPA: PAS domain-containing sensor histidine kinase [Exilispira sp.]|nr:PAS domain-containing sensor histidine kinase [Exilispira sp.]